MYDFTRSAGRQASFFVTCSRLFYDTIERTKGESLKMQPHVPEMQPRGCIVKGYPAFFPVVTHPDSDYVLTTIAGSQPAAFCTDLPLCPEI